MTPELQLSALIPPVVDFSAPEFRVDPYPAYARMRRLSPVFTEKRPFFGTAYLLTRYDDVLSALQDKRLVHDRRNVGDGRKGAMDFWWMPRFLLTFQRNIVASDGADHRRLRDLVHKAFTPRRVEQLSASIERVIDTLLERAARKQQVDLVADFALPLPLTIISEMLGVPEEDRLAFHRWTSRLLDTATPGLLSLASAVPHVLMLLRFLRRMVRLRREQPRDDLLSALVQAEEQGDRLSEDELLAMISILLLAGHETTVHLIGSGMLALLQDPEALRQLREHPEQLESAVEELLRYTNPVQQPTIRFAREDLEVHGYRIPRGAVVVPLLASANRDETVFPEPDRLVLTRSPNRHLSLGMGVHYCLGAPLARLEGRLAFEALVQRFPRMRLAVPPEKLVWRGSVALRGLKSLPVRLG